MTQELTKDQFRRLADPIKNYLIADGIDELNATVFASQVVEAQTKPFLALVAQETRKAYKKGQLEEVGNLVGYMSSIYTSGNYNKHLFKRARQIERELKEQDNG